MELDFFTLHLYETQKYNEVKKIFTNIKKRVNKKEQDKVKRLEKNVLGIMENLTEGVDY